jgi:hypothetical protein
MTPLRTGVLDPAAVETLYYATALSNLVRGYDKSVA